MRRIPADAICSIYLLYNFLYSYNAVTAGPDQFTVVRYHQDCSASALQFFEEYGGFFHYVNRCRLAHADAFLAEHPRADVDQVALEAGFNNRQSYYNARKRVREAS